MTGWLTPRGEYIEADDYEHHVALLGTALRDKIKPFFDRAERAKEACKRLQREQCATHAEWHTYEIASDDASFQARRIALDAGWIRVGLSTDGAHFELKNPTQERMQLCKDAAEDHGYTAIFEVVK